MNLLVEKLRLQLPHILSFRFSCVSRMCAVSWPGRENSLPQFLCSHTDSCRDWLCSYFLCKTMFTAEMLTKSQQSQTKRARNSSGMCFTTCFSSVCLKKAEYGHWSQWKFLIFWWT